ncbi:hypothetical protein HUT16_11460 [Kitasatospora sp. NA04385]|uniref:hypothetical protein n=1 Tax=Kitasatospora sp. NA04385 TaxID=2742135 RepID=UPI0015907BEB|nr:hypothetical protein [Kitasatospora sp. NA04385]QKW19602.1 hypothetical protein HUT16_11460 [Kitasatospora sp. NA04385]
MSVRGGAARISASLPLLLLPWAVLGDGPIDGERVVLILSLVRLAQEAVVGRSPADPR